MDIKEVSLEINRNAKAKGFWDKERNTGEMLMLVTSELAEALEADRKKHFANKSQFIGWQNRFLGKSYDDYMKEAKASFEQNIKNSFEDEIADAVIRLFDIAVGMGFDLEWHIENKMKYNETREKMHGKLY